MDALWNALQEGGIESWLLLIGAIIVGVIILRIVFELAETVIKIGCLVLFVAGIGWLLYTIFGGG
jgi:threonine/homoserine efflux transporter RhtA